MLLRNVSACLVGFVRPTLVPRSDSPLYRIPWKGNGKTCLLILDSKKATSIFLGPELTWFLMDVLFSFFSYCVYISCIAEVVFVFDILFGDGMSLLFTFKTQLLRVIIVGQSRYVILEQHGAT